MFTLICIIIRDTKRKIKTFFVVFLYLYVVFLGDIRLTPSLSINIMQVVKSRWLTLSNDVSKQELSNEKYV